MIRIIRNLGHMLSPENRICPTTDAIVDFLLPVFCVYYTMAVLVQLRKTTLLRVSLLPPMVFYSLRAALALDCSCGKHEQAPVQAFLFILMMVWTARAVIWALRQEPYKRDDVPEAETTSIPMALWNAWELLFNTRGIGWNWSQGIPIPRPLKKIHSRPRFLLYSAISLLFYLLAVEAVVETIRTFSPEFGTPAGASIVDRSLSPISRYLRCVPIAYLNVWYSYFAVQVPYQFSAIICVAFFFQDPSQWPPVFDEPWLSTSLSDFWGRRWQQTLRHLLIYVGGVPCAYLFGRGGGILGAFLLSGIIHDIETRALRPGGNIPAEVGFFCMQGVGILMERAWLKTTGRRVAGICGWIWTFTWLLLWGLPFVNYSTTIGRFATNVVPGGFKPTMYLISFVSRFHADQVILLNCLVFGSSLIFVVYSLFTSTVVFTRVL